MKLFHRFGKSYDKCGGDPLETACSEAAILRHSGCVLKNTQNSHKNNCAGVAL